MTRDEILAANPLVGWLEAKGIIVKGTRARSCPAKEHSRPDAVSVEVEKNLWHCHVCNTGGTLIDWLMIEKGLRASEVMAMFDQDKDKDQTKPKARPRPQVAAPASKVIATYDYTDAAGKLLYQVERLEPKSFRQRRPDGNGGWVYQTKDMARVLYRLPEVVKSPAVWIVEGEKDADTLVALGFVATSGDGGAENFRAEVGPLAGKHVIVCGDNDDKGAAHIEQVVERCKGLAKSVRRVTVPQPHKDITDYVNDFGDDSVAAEAVRQLLAAAEVLHGPMLRTLAEICAPKKDDPDELIKHRWLCKGGTALFVAPAGVGKSSFLMQCFALWTLGRPAFGLVPVRPLRCVFIQAENDDGDIAEFRDGVIAGLGLTEGEIGQVLRTVQFRTEFMSSGPKFCSQVVAPVLAESKADIIAIDPVLAYLGGDMKSQEVVGTWLRNHLLPVLKRYNAAAWLVHHTNKPPSGKEKPDWKADDFAYLGGGSAEFANFCRATMAIRAIGSHDIYELRASKRGGRLRWKDGSGNSVYHRYIGHSTEPGTICWREVSHDEASASGMVKEEAKGPSLDAYVRVFPESWVREPRQALLNGRELRQVFATHGWDYRTEPAVRAAALRAGRIQQAPGSGPEKLFGLPKSVNVFMGRPAVADDDLPPG